MISGCHVIALFSVLLIRLVYQQMNSRVYIIRIEERNKKSKSGKGT